MAKTIFRQPYDENYDSSLYSTPVGYDVTSDPVQNLTNMLEASLTDQSHVDSCDVNLIVKQYEKTGLLKNVGDGTLRYGDLTNLPTFQEAQNIVVAAKEAFADLPAKIRDRFQNDPEKLMEFIDNDENYDEAVKLGLVVKPVAADPVPSQPAAPAAETAPAA